MPTQQQTHDNTQNALLSDVSGYLESVKGYSENTVKSYRNDLIQFFRYLRVRFGEVPARTDAQDIDIAPVGVPTLKRVSLADIYGFLGYSAKSRGNSDATRKRKSAAIRMLYHYLILVVGENMPDPTRNMELPKVGKRDPIYMTRDEAISLLNAVDGRNKERDLAIILFFLNFGLRLSELTNIRLSDIQDETLHIIGKGNKERNLRFNDACYDAMQAYLPIRNALAEKTAEKETAKRIKNGISEQKAQVEPDDHLFLSNRGHGMTGRSVEYMVNKTIQKAGLDANKFTVHKLRHTAATLMYQYGQVDIRTLQKVLGHESVSTTEIYTHVDDETVRNAVMASPLAHYHHDK